MAGGESGSMDSGFGLLAMITHLREAIRKYIGQAARYFDAVQKKALRGRAFLCD
jgi:hypothetical protein